MTTPEAPLPIGAPSRSTRILVVDDQESVRLVIAGALEREGFLVDAVADGTGVVEALASHAYALVTLDVGLPGTDGLTILRGIRRSSDVPVIMLTGRDEEIDRIVGLEIGADDYLTKPFSGRELVARVRAVLRRTERGGLAGTDVGRPLGATRASSRDRLLFGDLEIDLGAREVMVAGRRIETTRREFDLLTLMAASPRQVFSREQLLRAVWGSSGDWQSPSTVTEHVRRLRVKLEVDARRPRWLETARGVGYRFVP